MDRGTHHAVPHPHEVPHQATKDFSEVSVTEQKSRADCASRTAEGSVFSIEGITTAGSPVRERTGDGERDRPEEVYTLVQVVDKGARSLRRRCARSVATLESRSVLLLARDQPGGIRIQGRQD